MSTENVWVEGWDKESPMPADQADRQLKVYTAALESHLNAFFSKEERKQVGEVLDTATFRFKKNVEEYKEMSQSYRGHNFTIKKPLTPQDNRLDGCYAPSVISSQGKKLFPNHIRGDQFSSLAYLHSEICKLRAYRQFILEISSLEEHARKSINKAKSIAHGLNERIDVDVIKGDPSKGIIEVKESRYNREYIKAYFPVSPSWNKQVYERGLGLLDCAGKNVIGLRMKPHSDKATEKEPDIEVFDGLVGFAQFKQGDNTWVSGNSKFLRIEQRFVARYTGGLPEGTREKLPNGTKWTVVTSTTPARAIGVLKTRMRKHLVGAMMGGL